MPGMMETVLNVGLNDASVRRARRAVSGDERFAWDSYRRLVTMFGKTVLGIDGDAVRRGAGLDSSQTRGVQRGRRPRPRRPEAARGDATRTSSASETGPRLPAAPARAARPRDPRGLRLVEHRPGPDLPPSRADPARPRHRREHLHDGVRQPRRQPRHRRGFTRDPATGRPGVYGDYLPNAQGEDVVAGIRNTSTLDDLAERSTPKAHAELIGRDASARDALPRPVRHRVHRSSAASCGCSRRASASVRRRRRSGSPPSSSTSS